MTVTDRYKQNVYDPNENKIRDIKDVLVDKSGKVVAPIDGVGGFLGAGEKDVAVPFETVHPTMKGKNWWQVIKPRKTVSKAPPVSNCLEHDVAVPDRPYASEGHLLRDEWFTKMGSPFLSVTR